MINNHEIVESSRSLANKLEFILRTISIIGIVVYKESDSSRFGLPFSGFSASLLH